ncbi:MAG: DUF4430 domain-containing protein [bacterium]|nr:DUF4430 domain-containing protein [bacterium]
MKNNITKIVIGVIILVIIIVIGVLVQNNDDNSDSNNSIANVNEVSEDTNKLSITTTIDNGETTTSYDKDVSSGTTALELINLISEEDGIVLGTTEYDFGTLIDSIDGIGEDVNDGQYWSFYVNDEMSMVGIADYTVNDNDIILMKYQAL